MTDKVTGGLNSKSTHAVLSRHPFTEPVEKLLKYHPPARHGGSAACYNRGISSLDRF